MPFLNSNSDSGEFVEYAHGIAILESERGGMEGLIALPQCLSNTFQQTRAQANASITIHFQLIATSGVCPIASTAALASARRE